jgi:hypothetical protein
MGEGTPAPHKVSAETKKPASGGLDGSGVWFSLFVREGEDTTLKMTDERWRAILEFHSAHNLTQTAKQFGLTPAGLIYWKRKFGMIPERQRYHDELDDADTPPTRTKEKARRLPPPLLDWSYPSPTSEAKFLFTAFDRSGGRLSIREIRSLIGITTRQEIELQGMVARGEISRDRVERAIAFRAAVLREFDRLVFAGLCAEARIKASDPPRLPLAFRRQGVPQTHALGCQQRYSCVV